MRPATQSIYNVSACVEGRDPPTPPLNGVYEV